MVETHASARGNSQESALRELNIEGGRQTRSPGQGSASPRKPQREKPTYMAFNTSPHEFHSAESFLLSP